MRTLNLSGFKQGDSLNISVSQGAITAGPYSIGSWGGGGDGGSPVIQTVRAPVFKINPESILFRIDHSASAFDSPGPEAEGRYDARKHEVYYFWDFDDPGTWTAPVNYLPGQNNRNAMIGPVVAHVFRDPGTHTVTCFMVEPSSGKTATATLDVEILDADNLYSGAGVYSAVHDQIEVGETVLINMNGDSDFSGGAAYPGAVQVVLDEVGYINTLETYGYNGNPGDPVATKKSCDRWSSLQSNVPSGADGYKPRRYLFKRGGTYNLRLALSTYDDCDVVFGAYGTGADPIINLAPANFGQTLNKIFEWPSQFAGGMGRYGIPPEIRLQNLDLRHTFDPSTQDVNESGPHTAQAIWPTGLFYLVVVDCKISGFGSCTMYLGTNPGTNCRVHIDNIVVENYGGQYTFMSGGSRHSDSMVAATGCRFTQHPEAIASRWNEGIGGYRNLMRLSMDNNIVYGCDLFHVMEGFHVLRPGDRPTVDGYNINVCRNTVEGGAGLAVINANLLDNHAQNLNRPFVNNALIEGNYYLASWEGSHFATVQGTGVTIRNNIYAAPANPIRHSSFSCFVVLKDTESFTGDIAPDYVLDSPIGIYNNTVFSARTYAQSGSPGDPVIKLQAGTPVNNFRVVNESNNVMHFPNYAGAPGGAVTTYAPLSTTPLFSARNVGWVEPNETLGEPPYSLNTSYATPAGSAVELKPLPGSAALGAALTGDVSYMDILGTTRTAPADKGAWEVE